jgi:hypothetical protein
MSEEIERAEEESSIARLMELVDANIDDEELLEEALSATYRLCVSLPNFDGIDSSKCVATMSASLAKWWEEPSLLEIIFGCIRCLASKSTEMQTMLCSAETVGLVVRCLDTHTDGEETVQELGCLVVEALARGSPANVDCLKQPEFKIGQVLARAEELITNERNKKYPVQAREALGL